MAQRRNTSGKRKSSGSRKASTTKKVNRVSRAKEIDYNENGLVDEICLLVLGAFCVILFLSNLNFIGKFGEVLSNIQFGLFGLMAYVFPIALIVASIFYVANIGNSNAQIRFFAGITLFIDACILSHIFILDKQLNSGQNAFEYCAEGKCGGGIIGGGLAAILDKCIGALGTWIIVLLILVICFILMTGISIVDAALTGSDTVRRHAEESYERGLARHEMRKRERLERQRAQMEEETEEKQLRMEKKAAKGVALNLSLKNDEVKENQNMTEIVSSKSVPQAESSVDSGEIIISNVKENDTYATDVLQEENNTSDFSEENTPNENAEASAVKFSVEKLSSEEFDFESFDFALENNLEKARMAATLSSAAKATEPEIKPVKAIEPDFNINHDDVTENIPVAVSNAIDISESADIFEKEEEITPVSRTASAEKESSANKVSALNLKPIYENEALKEDDEAVESSVKKKAVLSSPLEKSKKTINKKWIVPKPDTASADGIALLNASVSSKDTNDEELDKTTIELKEALATFGVNVEMTGRSAGPTVTRFEMVPERGTKVSKILNLADDIQMTLAATDVRIEAPIPGKSAVGIEIPNKVTKMVVARDVIESSEYKNFKGKIAFSVGKGLSGENVIGDIAKMPHVLVAGATGSGKSVCINMILMSILFKYTPDEVKLIMVDPKVVELNMYNGIPHLMFPVITDYKQAAQTLHWGVLEMEERYRKFADARVRDLEGYNNYIDKMLEKDPSLDLKRLPMIVIIVDELADLMMTAAKDIEESICRLAQLARACGIHLIVATQRPSVDVITGLIKANMPSRIAFAVSSGTDSRTILDGNGAEKLLGNGDMLFYPKGYNKPARIQGPYVSEEEVERVVEFWRSQTDQEELKQEHDSILQNLNSQGTQAAPGDNNEKDEYSGDEYLAEAAKLVLSLNKASISLLQRKFKIGYTRAARIMDELSDRGVVSPDEGTSKPRRILISEEQLENMIEMGEL